MILKRLGKSAVEVAAIGQGCMGIGGELSASSSRDREQIDALRLGIERGMTFIDTAEVYGGGHSEELVGLAVRGMRERAFIATKFSPEHNGYRDVLGAAERSLRRIGTDYIDLYQVHWPNPAIPMEDTMRAMAKLVEDGKVRHVGLSNFSVSEIQAARAAIEGIAVVSNQVEYNLFDRFVERRVLPYCTAEGITVIAYSPLDKGRVSGADPLLSEIGNRYGRSPAQVVLNWLICQPQVIVIPKATNPSHVRENAEAADFLLTDEEQRLIGQAFSSEPSLLPVKEISVSVRGEGNRRAYQTLEQALVNELDFTPSPKDLAEDILKGEPIKPVRVVPAERNSCRYDLIEGRIRYWAWVIAYGETRPIPALIRSSR